MVEQLPLKQLAVGSNPTQTTKMFIKNITKNKILSSDLKIAKSLSDQLLGLLKKSNPRSLMFNSRFGIHTLFLKHPIDVLILDSKNTVVKTAIVNPNSIFLWNPIYSKILELPKDTIRKTKTKVLDQLEIIDL